MGEEQLKLLLEAEQRGILPPDKTAILDEARNRGLVPPRERPAGGGDAASGDEQRLRAEALQLQLKLKAQEEARRTEDWAAQFVPQVVELPNGEVLEFPADMTESEIRAAITKEYPQYAPPAVPRTSGTEQFGSGINEGLANFIGAPVDLMTSALNAGVTGINAATGWNVPPIEDPVGGSGTMRNLLGPFISDTPPQGAGQRYVRRVGEEIGFGAPAALSMAAVPGLGAMARGNMPSYMAASTASDIGAGVAGQTATEIAPDKPLVGLLATLAGGAVPSQTLNLVTKRKPPLPTLDELGDEIDLKYRPVEEANAELTPEAWARLNDELAAYLKDKGIDPAKNLDVDTFGPVIREATRGADMGGGTVWDVEKWRRLINENVAGNPKFARHGMALKKRVDRFLASLTDNDLLSGDPAILENLAEARRLAHQKAKAETVLDAAGRGETRAATSGFGGNQVNATRQNLRPIYDKETSLRPGKRQGFTEDELKALKTAVKGTPWSNTLRNVGKLSPTSGVLGSLLTSGGLAGSAFSPAGPGAYAIPATLGLMGLVAKPMAEHKGRKHIQAIVDALMNGGKRVTKTPPPGIAANSLLELLKAPNRAGNQI